MSKSTLEIAYPERLRKMTELNITSDFSIGNFGHVPYGKTIEGRVVYIEENRDGCNSFGDTLKKYNDTNLIVIVDKGKCGYGRKTKNVEIGGGKLAIIINDNNKKVQDITMVNKKVKIPINIPAILVNQMKGIQIARYLSNSQTGDVSMVKLKMVFGVAQTNDHVEYEFYFDSFQEKLMNLTSSFKKYHNGFGASVSFTPRFNIYECKNCKGSIINDDCIINGKYCMGYGKNKDFRGREMISEVLREQCIWEGLNGNINWWNYIEKAQSQCNSKLSYSCSQSVQKTLDINWEKINKCVKDSAETNDKSNIIDNLILKEEQEYMNSLKNSTPSSSIIINGDMYRGDINPDYIKEAICSAFVNKPDTCQRFLASQIVDQDNFEHKSEYDTQQVKIPTNEESLFWPLILGFLLLIAVFCLLFKTKIFKKSKVTKGERIEVEVEELDVSNNPCL